MMLLAPPKARALFGHVAEERQRTIETQQQLGEQQQITGRWRIAAFALGTGVVVALVVGNRHREQNEERP